MNLSEQVTSLELSKRLQELGVKQESIWYWTPEYMKGIMDGGYFLATKPSPHLGSDREQYSAYTASELLELLPPLITIKPNKKLKLTITKSLLTKGVCVRYREQKKKGKLINIYDMDLSNSLAKMRIYLIENKLLETK